MKQAQLKAMMGKVKQSLKGDAEVSVPDKDVIRVTSKSGNIGLESIFAALCDINKNQASKKQKMSIGIKNG